MLELFLNPANMVVGGALVSSPVIIHLINRMRYRRVRWAAMEFLLKSQKRNRRRLIIEQLILLLLRILLVLLAGLLLARFLGFSFAGFFQPQNSLHVVLLDDRLSMSDAWKTEEGERKNAFDVAKGLVEKEVAKPAGQAHTPQRLVLLRLSDPRGAPLFDQRLTEDSQRELAATLARADECTALHLNVEEGVKAARELFDRNAQDQRFLHLVSDFRQRHWAEPEGAGVTKALESLAAAGVKVNMVDAAHPVRSESQKVPLYHDNLAIVDLRPETRVAPEGMPVLFTVTVANYSPGERKNLRVTVKVEGVERPEGSITILSVPPGLTSQTFQVAFVQPGFNQITANLENEEVGLQADNLRYAVIEVRRQVPVLLVDGDLTGGDKPGGDSFPLRTVFTAARGFDVVRAGVSELERPNLDQYPSIYLLDPNPRQLAPKALANLEAYVKNGGSVAFFLGDRVVSDFYNNELYKNGKGLFPVPLADRPTPPPTDAERAERLLDGQAKLFVRGETHPVFAEAFKDEKEREFLRASFRYITFDRYYPVPRLRWETEPARQVEEVLTLPNRRSPDDYRDQALQIRDALPTAEPKYEKYRARLETYQRAIRDSLSGKNLFELANALDGLLTDKGAAEDPQRPNLVEFWESNDPKLRELRARAERLRDTVRYGDPLLVTARYEKGRVAAFLSTAGTRWSDWSGGSPGSGTFPGFVLDLQKFLSSQDTGENLTVGTPREFTLDVTRYQPKLRLAYQGEVRDQGGDAARPPAAGDKDAAAPPAKPGLQDLGELSGTESGNLVTFLFERSQRPGVYYFDLLQRSEMGAEPKAERRAVAYNVDGPNESDLRRQPKDDLTRIAAGSIYWHTPGVAPPWATRRADLSESAWLYLVFLIILVAEQALAVHLSFHLKGNEAALPAQAVRPQAA